jgi:hypothetical membrane protein
VLFLGTLAGALAQPDEFSLVDHANSDLGADTAASPWLSNQLGSNVPGALLLVFAVGLWRSLGRHPSARVGSALVGLVGVCIFLTGFFRLDCREIDAGCDIVSWHATAHVITAGVTILALLAAPFVLARALKHAPAWRDLWLPTLAFGVATIVTAVVASAVGEGLGGLLAVFVWFVWITVLAIRLWRLAERVEGGVDVGGRVVEVE